MSAPLTFKKRLSLREQLDHLATCNEDERSQLIEELERDYEAAEQERKAAQTFRQHPPDTIRRQDHHLQMYDSFVFNILKKEDRSKLSEEEINAILFPDDQVELRRQISLFLIYAFKQAQSSAETTSTTETHTLEQCKDSMKYWAGYHYDIREHELDTRSLLNDMVRTTAFMQHTYGDPPMTKAKTIQRLVDHIHRSSPATSNQMHDELKTAAGWYEEDVRSSLSPSMRSDTGLSTWEHGKRLLEEIGIVLTPGNVLLAPIPHETIPGLMRGPPPVDNLADRYPHLIGRGFPSDVGVIPAHLRGLLKPGFPPPGHYRDAEQ